MGALLAARVGQPAPLPVAHRGPGDARELGGLPLAHALLQRQEGEFDRVPVVHADSFPNPSWSKFLSAPPHYVIFSSFSWQDLEDAKIGAFIESGVLEMNKGNLEFIRESYPFVVSMFAISKGKDYCALIVPSRRGQDDDQSCSFDEAEARDFLCSSANISLKKKLLRGAPPAFLTDDAFPDVINAQILEDHFDISEIDGVDRFVNSSNERLRLVATTRLVEWLEVHGPDSLMVKDCAIDAICESSREDRAFVLDVIRGQIERRSAVRRAIVSRWFEAARLDEYVDLLSGRQVRIPNTPKDESLLAVLRQWGLCSTFRPLKDAPSLFTVRPKGTKKARGSHHGK